MNIMDTPLCQVPLGEYLKAEREVGVSVQLAYTIAVGLVTYFLTKLYQRYQTRKATKAVSAPFSDASTTPCMAPPPGWICTRETGHGGPCAAIPIASTAWEPPKAP